MSTTECPIPVDTPGDYARGLLDLLGARDPLDVMEESPSALRALFDGLDDATIRMPEAPGKWSMIEVAHHLADSDMVVGVRIRMIVAQDRPPIVAYDQDLWVAKLRYRRAALFDVLAQFDVLRAANLRLARQLTPAELERFGVHTERGGESAGYLLRLVAGESSASPCPAVSSWPERDREARADRTSNRPATRSWCAGTKAFRRNRRRACVTSHPHASLPLRDGDNGNGRRGPCAGISDRTAERR
ncbi:MAG: hypothetical protein QOK37_3717 [Thermoanaerobaculia bacterium]|nr:hypothetical protein [Thermoanaerobaculia bacterium]